MKIKRSLRFISLLKNHHGIHQQKNTHTERLVCVIIKARSVSLPQQQEDLSAIISLLLAYDAADVMDNDNLVIVLLAHIQISIVLIGTARKPSVVPIVLDKRWANP